MSLDKLFAEARAAVMRRSGVVDVGAGHGSNITEDKAIQAVTSGYNIDDFLRAVLPRQGRVCVWPRSGANVWFPSVEDFILQRGQFDGESDIYFATAGFGDGKSATSGKRSRGGDNVTGKRAYYVDIDVRRDDGGHVGGYADAGAARDALKAFVAATKLVPSYVISTGSGGLHAYWCIDEDIGVDEWKRTAEALKRLCARHGLKADPAITSDVARVLRLPGTVHGRTGRDVVISKATGRVFTNSEFRALVGVSGDLDDDGADVLGLGPLPEHLRGVEVDLLPMLAQEHPPANFERIKAGCGAVRGAVEHPEGASEPLWRGVLGIVKFCKDSETLAHEVSEGHPGYSRDETERKLSGWTAGPTTCQYFKDHAREACAACSHPRALDDLPIFRTPVALGRVVDVVEPLVGADGSRQKVVLPPAVLHRELPDWLIRRNSDGDLVRVRPHPTADNIAALARLLGWTIRHNVMTRKTELLRDGLRTSADDIDNIALQVLADDCTRHGVGTKDLAAQVDVIAHENTYHPALQWLEAVPWDGVSRRAEFAASLVLVDPTKAGLRNALLDAWMLTAIGALVEPEGIAAQGVLTLQGPQGVGKTRWAASLCPAVPGAVRTGMSIDPDSKDSVLQCTSAWLVELGELDGVTRRRDVASLKAFLTRSVDVVRQPYARKDTSFKRRTCFIGTVNNEQFLMDDTGNRRFWTIAISGCEPLPEDVMRQVWAEYLHRYRAGQRGHLAEEFKRELNASNENFEAADPIFEKLATSFDWHGVDWRAVAAKDPKAMESVVWLSAPDIGQLIGIDVRGKADSTKIGSSVAKLQRLILLEGGSGTSVEPSSEVPLFGGEVPLILARLVHKTNAANTRPIPKRRISHQIAA